MVKYIEQQAIAREIGYKAVPLSGVDMAMQRNYELGIVAGMRLAAALPSRMADLERETFNELLEQERSNGDV